MASEQPIVIGLTNNHWDARWGSRQRLIQGMGERGWRTAYSVGPLNTWDIRTSHWANSNWRRSFRQDCGVLVDTPGKLPVGRIGNAAWQHLALHWYASSMRNELGIEARNEHFVVVCFHPVLAELALALKPGHLVYFPYDDFSAAPEWSEQLRQLEHHLLAESELIVGYSLLMTDRLAEFSSAPRRALPLGVDMAQFEGADQNPIPADLADIPRPRIGYAGSLNQKLDWTLLLRLARQRPELNWVFIGGLTPTAAGLFDGDEDILTAWKAFDALPNSHFLGQKPHSEIASYIAHMDVNIMPYSRKKGWWMSGYPLKMHEYLATGNPVVSSDLPTVLEFSGPVAIAQAETDWLASLDRLIADDSAAARRLRVETARNNSWDNRFDRLDRWLTALLERTPTATFPD